MPAQMVHCHECDREMSDWDAFYFRGNPYCENHIGTCNECGDTCERDQDYCENCREDRENRSEIIHGYHDNDPTEMGWWKNGKRLNPRLQRDTWLKTRFFGMELEFEADHNASLDPLAERCLDTFSGKAMAEYDGSLNHGFEIVTAPMDYDTMHKAMEAAQIPSELKANMGCGLHIHVSRKSLSSLTIGKLLVFVHDPKNYDLISHLARRPSTHYCERPAKKLCSRELFGYNRYQAVNTTNSNTIEFRMFRSAKTTWRILAALETVQALIEWCEQTSIRDLSAASFMAYAAKHQTQYANLVRLLDGSRDHSWVTVRTRFPRKPPMPAKYRVPGWHGPANVNDTDLEEAA